MTFPYQARGQMNLQTTLASASAGPAADARPHHPITCPSDLRYEPDGSLRCEHASVPPDDLRTRWCVHHSVAMLLIELAGLL